MASTFNPVPAATLHEALEAAGFAPILVGREYVYERPHHRAPSLKVRVFTSAHVNQSTVAACGKDAIRATLVYVKPDGTTRGIFKKGTFKIVKRTGTTEGIIERMLERAREAYGKANDIAKTKACTKCKGPCYPNTSRCISYCWKAQKG